MNEPWLLYHYLYQLLIFYQNDDSEKNKYEEKNSQSFTEYIYNDKLLSLPISILHRILTKSRDYNQNLSEDVILIFYSNVFENSGEKPLFYLIT